MSVKQTLETVLGFEFSALKCSIEIQTTFEPTKIMDSGNWILVHPASSFSYGSSMVRQIEFKLFTNVMKKYCNLYDDHVALTLWLTGRLYIENVLLWVADWACAENVYQYAASALQADSYASALCMHCPLHWIDFIRYSSFSTPARSPLVITLSRG